MRKEIKQLCEQLDKLELKYSLEDELIVYNPNNGDNINMLIQNGEFLVNSGFWSGEVALEDYGLLAEWICDLKTAKACFVQFEAENGDSFTDLCQETLIMLKDVKSYLNKVLSEDEELAEMFKGNNVKASVSYFNPVNNFSCEFKCEG